MIASAPSSTCMRIALDQLEAHAHNSNVMPERLLAKLEARIRATGRYPPLIVRPQGDSERDSRYQILDGHHRALVLRRLGHRDAWCDVWHGIDDREATMLLLTLNRLRGEDDPHKRGDLLAELTRHVPPRDLARAVPDDAAHIERLLALRRAPGPVAPPPDLDAMPQAVTFFLTEAQRRRLFERLRAIDADRNRALITVLGLSEDAAEKQENPAGTAGLLEVKGVR